MISVEIICSSPLLSSSMDPESQNGPTADNFRPLGMRSTFERVIREHCDSHDQSHCSAPPSLSDGVKSFVNYKMLFNPSNLFLTMMHHVHACHWTYPKPWSGLTHIGFYRFYQRAKPPGGSSCIPGIYFFTVDVDTRSKANCYPLK